MGADKWHTRAGSHQPLRRKTVFSRLCSGVQRFLHMQIRATPLSCPTGIRDYLLPKQQWSNLIIQ